MLKQGLDKVVIDLTDLTAVERRAVFAHLRRLRRAERARIMLQRGYRKNKATFHAVPPARDRPPPATLRPRVPTPGGGPPAPRGPPGVGLARAGLEAPPPAAGQPWREPAGHRPAPPGPARTAAGPPARLGRRGGDCGSGTAFATTGAHPPCRPRAPARGLPQRTRAQGRPPGAASAGRQTAAAGPARLG
jgi:hypothetical protein